MFVFGNENGGVKETEDNGGNGACRERPESFARGGGVSRGKDHISSFLSLLPGSGMKASDSVQKTAEPACAAFDLINWKEKSSSGAPFPYIPPPGRTATRGIQQTRLASGDFYHLANFVTVSPNLCAALLEKIK